eukprot:6214523-Pleurochrysis_carterae.AAC.3
MRSALVEDWRKAAAAAPPAPAPTRMTSNSTSFRSGVVGGNGGDGDGLDGGGELGGAGGLGVGELGFKGGGNGAGEAGDGEGGGSDGILSVKLGVTDTVPKAAACPAQMTTSPVASENVSDAESGIDDQLFVKAFEQLGESCPGSSPSELNGVVKTAPPVARN